MDVMERIRERAARIADVGVDKSSNDVHTTLPLDGDLYATSEYLKTLSNKSNEFYRRYLDHLKYFTSLFKFRGHKDIERLNIDIFRQLIEFGKVAIVNVKGRPVVCAVNEIKLNLYKDPVKISGMATREGYGYRKEYKAVNLPLDKTVFIKENYQAIPFIFFWKDIINNIIKLRKVALTASVASVKKFKRNVQNNDSTITRAETMSMANPDTSFIDNIVNPVSYLSEIERSTIGDVSNSSKAYSTIANSIEMNSIDSNTASLFDNLKEYISFEYFQRGRRVNTNKKEERNIKKEIDTETINFDILESELYDSLIVAAEKLSKIFNTTITVESKILEMQKVEEEEIKYE